MARRRSNIKRVIARVTCREIPRNIARVPAGQPSWCEDGATFKKFALNKAIKDAWRTGLEVDDLFCEFSSRPLRTLSDCGRSKESLESVRQCLL